MAPMRVVLCLLIVSLLSIADGAEPIEISGPVSRVTALRYPRSVEQLRLLQDQVQQVAAQAIPATVGIIVGDGVGSGVIVSPEGLVLTAGHVIGEANRRARILLPDGRRLLGRTLGANHDIDAGMVQLENPPDDLPYLPIAKTQPTIGEWVITTGQPGGMFNDRSPPLRLGRVLGMDDDWVCTDCTLVGGDSGGPLVNLRGEVLGVHSSIGPAIVHNFHIPVVEIRRSWDRLLASEVWGGDDDRHVKMEVRPLMGVRGKTEDGRCIITDVFRGFPADEADVRVGDTVLTVDGSEIASFEQLSEQVRQLRPGKKISLQILRDGEQFEVEITLAGVRMPVPDEEQQQPDSPNNSDAEEEQE